SSRGAIDEVAGPAVLDSPRAVLERSFEAVVFGRDGTAVTDRKHGRERAAGSSSIDPTAVLVALLHATRPGASFTLAWIGTLRVHLDETLPRESTSAHATEARDGTSA